MKFYKVSLDQFSKDYAKTNGLGPIGDWSEEDRKKVIDIWANIKLPYSEKEYWDYINIKSNKHNKNNR